VLRKTNHCSSSLGKTEKSIGIRRARRLYADRMNRRATVIIFIAGVLLPFTAFTVSSQSENVASVGQCDASHVVTPAAPAWAPGALESKTQVASVVSRTKSVAIVGHRGAAHDAPENTVMSAKLAWAQNADAVETDIRLTKDGQIIVSHDDTTYRINGCNTRISDMTFAEARALDAGLIKGGPRFAGQQMPTLDELIETIPAGKRLFVEVKTGTEIIPALGESLARTHARGDQIVLISFNLDVLRQAHAMWPEYSTLWLVSYDAHTSIEKVIAQAQEARVSGLDLSSAWPLDHAMVGQIKAANLQLHVWTVDGLTVAKIWADLGVDGITTNRAGWLRSQLES
jgi:glycerophosphoryl diester phosphodiesterase